MRDGVQYHFGNNFYALFEANRVIDFHPDHPFIFTYLELILNSFEKEWQLFLQENDVLINAINSLLIVRKKLSYDAQEVLNLLREREFDKAEEKEKELDLKKRESDLWQQLNPLLIQAVWLMERLGIEAINFGSWTSRDFDEYRDYVSSKS